VSVGSGYCCFFSCYIKVSLFIFGCGFEETNGQGSQEKEVNSKWESDNYSGGGKESNSVKK
jgi:hypothetical protein